ncbi:hypothetical protein ACHAW6_000825 [Cyclotella cf. meneghiniana]
MDGCVLCIAAMVAELSRPGSAFLGPLTLINPRSESPMKLFLQRREFVDGITRAIVVGTATTAGFAIGGTTFHDNDADALDMDIFEKSLIEKDTAQCNPKLDPKCIPKLTPDEALCKYGVSGSDARTAACKRVRDAGGLLPESKPGERKTAGWVNNPIAL